MLRSIRLCLAAPLLWVASPFASAASEAILLWPADHAANQGPAPDRPDREEGPDAFISVVSHPSITPFLPSKAVADARRTAIVICPGGGYSGLAVVKEGNEVAQWLAERDMVGLVLRYRCGGGANQQPVPWSDAQRALRVVRSRAAEWGVDPDRLGILGFSAGGHLASTAATQFDDGDPQAVDPIERFSSRPSFAVLVYPVISLAPEVGHAGSRKNLLGAEPSAESIVAWSSDQQVSEKTPPTFLVHASDDAGVQVKNSLLFYEALIRHGVSAEMHIYKNGGHGFGMYRNDRSVDRWPDLLEAWLP